MSDEHQQTPTQIGPYRLHEVLGEGGMGSVYRAVQLEPVHREVALKIVKLGMDTKEVIARFESERQALAVMDHSNIAKVLAAGASESGRPYFVMELVRGVPINEYCDTHKLDTAARIDLFVQVCEAVQHAHQKGVIHRDLKPSNVLVTVQDSRPVPKVIDFGIAKAIGTSLTDRTLVTAIGQALGTPAYMSPEQAERSSLDVDTRTDVYSLGVMLYELLSGALPFSREALRKPDFVLQYLLRETDVPTPSARLGSLADTQETVARNRHTDVRTLRRQLTGDLDWIVMRAMEKDRTRRYGTAWELAADLRRYLEGEPVSARPPSVGYRLGKFARRHRGALAAGLALAISLVVGVTASTIGFVRAERNAELASAEADRAEAVSSFLDQMLRAADPVNGGGPNMTVQEVLDLASAEVEGGALDGDPLVEIAVRRSIGGTYMLLGLFDDAETHLVVARELLETTPGATAMERVTVLDELGQLRRRQGDSAASEALYRHALALADSTGLSTDGGEGELKVNGVRNDLSLALRGLDRLDEAEEILEELADSRRRLAGAEGDLDLATTLNNLALVKRSLGDLDGAIALFHETLESLRAIFGESHLYVAAVMESIGSLEQSLGRYEVADSLMTRALAMRREIVGNEHRDVINGLRTLGLLHVDMGNHDEARELLEEALPIAERVLGPEHPSTGAVHFAIGRMHMGRQDPAAAEAAFRRTIAIREESLGDRHRLTLNAHSALATALVLADRNAEAEVVARYVVGLQDDVEVREPDMLGAARLTWGRALAALGRYEEAEQRLLESHEIHEAAFGAEHRSTLESVDALVDLYERSGDEAKAAEWRGRAGV